MKKKKLWKDIKKCFSHTKGRFISIFALMMLGSFALVGLKVTGPNIRDTGNHYFQDLNLSDITVIGDYGIDKENQKAINQLSGSENIEYGYLKDVEIKESTDAIRILSNPDEISKYELIEGRNANKDSEIVLSNTYADKYKIGDTIKFSEKEDASGNYVLKKHSFKIVGFVNSPEFLSSINMGQSSAGAGELKGYAFVKDSVFDSDYYMLARITFKDTKNVDPYTKKYTDCIQNHKSKLEKLLVNQPELRLEAIKKEYQKQIDDGQKQIDEAKQKLSNTEKQLANANKQIEEAKATVRTSDTKLQEAQKQLLDGQTQLNEKWTQLHGAKQELDSAKGTLQVTESQLNTAHQGIAQGWEQIDAVTKEIASKEAELSAGKSQIGASKQALNDGEVQYEDVMASYEQNIDALNKQLENPNLYSEEKDKLNQQLAVANAGLQAVKTEYQSFMKDTYTPQISVIEAKEQELSENEAKLNQSKQTLLVQKQLLEKKELEYNAGYSKYQEGIDLYNQSLNTYYTGLATWEDSFKTLSSKDNEYKENVSKIELAKKELAEKEGEYQNGLKEFHEKQGDAEKQISENEEKLADARESMDQLELPVYSLNTRREVPGSDGYKIYDTISVIIDSLANVFPIFLYFVAALVTLTTMTRFVDEERINSGTLKALGYTDQDVMKKFTIYGLVSGLTGSITGIVLGHILVPIIIYNAYGASFDVPQIEMHFYLKTTIIALILAMISTVLPAWIVASRELREKPAALLLPKPPAKGSKIFLEHIKPLWNNMSFTHKVTARNIFRYKKRMLMTIFGVSGAVTLLFAGFSVQNSISGINEKQFGEIIKYDLIVAQNNNLNDEEQKEMDTLLSADAVKQQSPVYYDSLTKVAGKNQDKQSIKLIVSKDEAEFDDYIALEHRKTQKKLDLRETDGAIISERFANLLNVEVGDSITIYDSNNRDYKLKVADITEMYTGHFLFMNDSYYEKSFSKEYEPNANLIILKDKSTENARIQASKFMQSDCVKGVVQNMTLTNQIDTIVVSLNKVMQVLIIVAIMLAVVILYNLTNINIAERIRELSTIKVLGFYDKEVTMYIYRETILLSLIGILAGFVFGNVLYRYILAVVPPDEVMFNPALGAKAFIVPVMLIIGITIILGYIMNKKLSKLDMLSALKSVD